jgi:phage gp36-like protein
MSQLIPNNLYRYIFQVREGTDYQDMVITVTKNSVDTMVPVSIVPRGDNIYLACFTVPASWREATEVALKIDITYSEHSTPTKIVYLGTVSTCEHAILGRYANIDDMIDRYHRDFIYMIADKNNNDILDSQPITHALDDASDLINSYLTTRYSLPLKHCPPILKRYCVDIAIYWLCDDIGVATLEKRQRYQDGINWLQQISQGDIKLNLPPQTPHSNNKPSDTSTPTKPTPYSNPWRAR